MQPDITILNGSCFFRIVGTMALPNRIQLHNVLYVPQFKFNLISISKFTKNLYCSAHFYPSYCCLQELSTVKVIGWGKEYNSLHSGRIHYNLCLWQVESSLFQSLTYGIGGWDILVHLNLEFVKLDSKISSKNLCDRTICALAKQIRLPFNSSFIKTATCF